LPLGEGLFLADEGGDGRLALKILDKSSADLKLIGIEAENAQLNGTSHSFFRIWLDSEHGYMMSRMERCWRFETGETDLTSRMKVERFIKPDKEIWVPAEASISYFTGGRKSTEYSMKLDEKQSSFNRINSNELFIATSLPGVNYERDGWKWNYPSAILSKVRDFDVSTAIFRKGNTS
ncbi:MAG: hypothetical protein M3Y82_10480, partial [Verrucomicrobiota bacterium]|nr:hypothetical protein [Verrucomicrobiota bacterium]